MAIEALYDVRVFQPLKSVADSLGIEFTLFGSVATRIALLRDSPSFDDRDLFSVAEHASDIDLAHSGPPSSTPIVQQLIYRCIPMAPWFRWNVVDRDRFGLFERQEALNANIPLRRIRISGDPRAGFRIPSDTLDDAKKGKAAFQTNDGFLRSPRAKFDTEASAALVYLDAIIDLLDTKTVSKLPVQDDWILESLGHAVQRGLKQLGAFKSKQRRLAVRRLWYRLAASALRLSPQLLGEAIERFHLGSIVAELQSSEFGEAISSLISGAPRPFVISSALASEKFRIDPAPDAELLMGLEASDKLQFALDRVAKSTFDSPSGTESSLEAEGSFRLGEEHEIVAAVSGLKLNPGPAPSIGFIGALRQDFAHVSVELSNQALERQDPTQMAVVAIGHQGGGQDGAAALLPVFSSVSKAIVIDGKSHDAGQYSRVTLRMNIGNSALAIESMDVFLVRYAAGHG